METIKKGKILVEGKTKKIFSVEGDDSLVIVEAKNAITAFDDPDFTKEFDTKAKYANITTSRIFELLAKKDIPVAFVEQFSDTAFVSPKCTMIPLEVVARRYAVGSYLKRHPNPSKIGTFCRKKLHNCTSLYKHTPSLLLIFFDKLHSILKGLNLTQIFAKNPATPYRFDKPLIEFFLKTTKGKLVLDGETILDGLDPKEGEEDPFINTPYEKEWQLLHPKKLEKDADLNKSVQAFIVLPTGVAMENIRDITERTFLAIEELWAKYDFKLIDFKIELGVDINGGLLVADVIDNDSWRLRDKNWNDISKQSFRDGESLDVMEDKYALVARLLEKQRSE